MPKKRKAKPHTPKRRTPKQRRPKKTAKVPIVYLAPDPVPEEIEVAVVLPAPMLEEPEITWQTKGHRLYIKIRDFVLDK